MFVSVGDGLIDARHYAEAKKVFVEATSELTAPPDASYTRSSFYLRAGIASYRLADFDDSVKYLQKAINEHTGTPPPYWYSWLGDALWKLGRREEAIGAWREGILASGRISGLPPSVMESVAEAAAKMKKSIDYAGRGEEPPIANTDLESQMRPMTQPVR